MAEELEDGIFWLPSQFLTDDDILKDLSPPTTTTTTDSDEDDSLSGLTHQLNLSSLHSKGLVSSTSPKSTLCGCVGKDGSSLSSPNLPVSPPLVADKDGAATWDLLHKAAGEVARFKMRTEIINNNSTSGGTGFFDCSNIKNNNNRGPFCPPPRPAAFFPHLPPPPPPQFSLLSQIQQIRRQQQQQRMMNPQLNRSTRSTNNNNKNDSNTPLGLPPSAWPPLKPQNEPIQSGPQMFVGQNGPKRECVGTGVFLPRRVNTPSETRKKSDGNSKKGGKGSHRRNSKPPVANPVASQLPQEWTY